MCEEKQSKLLCSLFFDPLFVLSTFQCIDEGKLPMWAQLQAPPIAKNYWQLAVGFSTNSSLLHDQYLLIHDLFCQKCFA